MTASAWVLRLAGIGLVAPALGCPAQPERGSADAVATAGKGDAQGLDLGGLRASLVEGLEAAAREPGLAIGLGLATTLETDPVERSAAALVAALQTDPALAAEAARMFESLQDGSAMRGALVEFATQHPDLDAAELSVGFVGYVDARLTRAELADALRDTLAGRARALDPALARALMVDAGGARALAAVVIAQIQQLEARGELAEHLGRDPGARAGRLERRLADPDRAAGLIATLGVWLGAGPGAALVAALLDDPRSASLLAAGLTRALADEQVRARLELLFGHALATSFDAARFAQALAELLAEPAVEREAQAWLSALARSPGTRDAIAATIEQFASQDAFEAVVRECIG